MDDLDLSAALQSFLAEGRELTNELEQGLLKIEQGHDRSDMALIHALFRAAHTIKGSAGIVGLVALSRFTHGIESILDRVREGEPLLDAPMISQLLRCCDHMVKLIDMAEQGDLLAASLADQQKALLAQLGCEPGPDVPEQARASGAKHTDESGGFRLFMVFGADCFKEGLDPVMALLYLTQRCTVSQTVLLADRLPDFEDGDPEACALAIGLVSPDGTVDLAKEAMEYFLESSLMVVWHAHADASTISEGVSALRAELGEDLIAAWRDAGLITEPLPAAQANANPTQDVPQVPDGKKAGVQVRSSFVRVPSNHLDDLISQVGELVIAGATVESMSRSNGDSSLQEAVGALMQLIDVIQSNTLQMRMVPIGETFNKFQRIVRDVSRDLGKKVSLEILGADTELDKAMVEKVGDPLMHLVRNALDHGLEAPDVRAQAGKPEQGILRLRAFQDSGSVVIEISDDGAGLHRDKIVNKAIERGLIAGGDGLSDSDVYQLIFEPGFSTAAQVTSLSGRGVGMDVVKKNVEALRGSIALYSQPGQGTLIQLRLPLTLAIIDGFLISVGGSRFIVPLDLLVECIELPADALDPQQPHYFNLRGEVLPYLSLRQAFDLGAQEVRRPSIVVVRCADVKFGLLVDVLHGEMQTVIKPMTGVFRNLRTICGTSILGSGDIALILDVHQLIQSVGDAARHPDTAATTGLMN